MNPNDQAKAFVVQLFIIIEHQTLKWFSLFLEHRLSLKIHYFSLFERNFSNLKINIRDIFNVITNWAPSSIRDCQKRTNNRKILLCIYNICTTNIWWDHCEYGCKLLCLVEIFYLFYWILFCGLRLTNHPPTHLQKSYFLTLIDIHSQ